MKNTDSKAVGYLRVSTEDQGLHGAGLAAQLVAIEAEVARRGLELVEVFEDRGASGKSLRGRPGLDAAISAVESGAAGILIVSKVDRLTRSVRDAADLMERSARRGWGLVALDVAVDTSTASGEFVASVVVAAGQLERRMIGQRTRDALQVKRSQGIVLGRRAVLPESILSRIVEERTAGASYGAIADMLTAESIPTAHGGVRWYASTVSKVFERATRETAA